VLSTVHVSHNVLISWLYPLLVFSFWAEPFSGVRIAHRNDAHPVCVCVCVCVCSILMLSPYRSPKYPCTCV